VIIQVNASDVEKSPALVNRAEDAVNKALSHYNGRITRVEVHLHGNDGPNTQNDQRVVMEARVAGMQPLMVDCTGADMYSVIDEAGGKLHRAVAHKMDKLKDHHQ